MKEISTCDNEDFLYHLTNIDDCADILRSNTIVPYIQLSPRTANCAACNSGILRPDDFIHLNFCPRSLMLYYLTQGHCWSRHKIYGQEDAVHIEIKFEMMMISLGLKCMDGFMVSDIDFEHGNRDKITRFFDAATPMSDIESTVDMSAINKRIGVFDAERYSGKGAEIMIGTTIDLTVDMVSSIVVHDAKAKCRLMKKRGVPAKYLDKVTVRPEWYF